MTYDESDEDHDNYDDDDDVYDDDDEDDFVGSPRVAIPQYASDFFCWTK